MILEEILSDVGDNGRFQIIFTAVITIMEVVIAWSMLQTALIGATPSWWCVDPATYGFPNMTLDNTTYQTCSVAADVVTNGHANGYVNGFSNSTDIPTTTLAAATSSMSCVRYYDPGMVTIVGEWDLVCERKYIKAVINSVQMAGVLVGSVMAGQSSDSIGRRLTCYVTMVLHALTCLVSGFATTWQMYAVLRFFVGGAIGSYLVLHYVYVIEFVRHTWRPYLASIPAWALGAGMLCLTAWQVPNWRHLNFICAGLTVPMVFGWFSNADCCYSDLRMMLLRVTGVVERGVTLLVRVVQGG